jgi:exosortase/archaeosortase family protein
VRLRGEWLLLLGALLVAAALYSHYIGGNSALLIELTMVALGIILAFFSLKAFETSEENPRDGLLTAILSRFVPKEKIAILIPFLGFIILLSWSAWKIGVGGSTDLQMQDFVVTLFSLSLVLYLSGPSKLQAVRDFVVLYLMFLTIVFVIIWRVYEILSGGSSGEIAGYAEYYVVTEPMVGILQTLGFHTHAILDLNGPGLSNIIEYPHGGVMLRVGIGTGCSGLYSAGLFFSAFLAFVLVRYRKVDRYIGAALGIGFLLTWAANIIRMVITVLTGIAWGQPALATVHSYLGVLIFVAFITVFWTLTVRWLDRKEPVTIVSPRTQPQPSTAK